MAANTKQKIWIADINVATQAAIEAKLAAGYVIENIVSLTPTYTKLLIVYAEPPEI